jgi:hypothetical protein
MMHDPHEIVCLRIGNGKFETSGTIRVYASHLGHAILSRSKQHNFIPDRRLSGCAIQDRTFNIRRKSQSPNAERY